MTSPSRLQSRIESIGTELLERAREIESGLSPLERWQREFMRRLEKDANFRVQALRFIDVLPVLKNDSELARHASEYFAAGDLPLPPALQWGFRHAHTGMAAHVLAPLVREIVEWIGRRFIAGEDAEDALTAVKRLHGQGFKASLDILGEVVLSEAEAARYQKQYLDLIEVLSPRLAAIGERLQLSLKISSLHSQITPLAPAQCSEAIRARLRPILREVRKHGGGVTLDMEHYDTKEITLRTFRDVLEEPEFADWPDCGIAIQAYLKDTEQDLRELIAWTERRGAPIHVRLVRGAYWDYETVIARRQGWASPVWESKNQTDENYERCLSLLLSHTQDVRPAIAGHNIRSIAMALALIEDRKIDPSAYEFQMLYGMAAGLRQALAEKGHALRVYVPVGAILPGMAYLVRRLLENSANTSFLRRAFAEERPAMELLAPPAAVPASTPAPAGFAHEPVHRFTDADERERLAAAIQEVRTRLGGHYPLRIGGRNVETAATIVSVNPAAPDEIIGQTSAADREEADAAVRAATEAGAGWGRLPTTERCKILRHAADMLAAQREVFTAWEILEAGKPWREADADVCEAIDYLRYYADRAEAMAEEWRFDTAGESNCYRYRPRGVAVILPPWNFPLAILTGMLSAALVTGNAAIVKPSSQTPVVAAELCALLETAGIPPGVVNFLPGEGSSVGEYLVRHAGVHMIAFTGSLAVGCRIQRLAADCTRNQSHVKQVLAEMGGKNAIIVDTDADLDDAITGIIASAFGYSGQKCSACSRLITVGDIHAVCMRRLCEAVESIVIGPPEAPRTFMGPLISAAARKRLLRTIENAGARAKPLLRVEAERPDGGYYLGPVIFDAVEPQSPLAQEELFGPVLAVLRAPDFESALRLANGTRYALTGGVYSRSPAHLAQASEEFRVGNLYLNRKITGAVVGRQPFGGLGMSGTGFKAGGPDYLLQFVQARTVTENTLRRGFAPDTGS